MASIGVVVPVEAVDDHAGHADQEPGIGRPLRRELRDPDRAWEIARAMIRELLKTDVAEGDLLNATLEVTDDDGEIVLSESDSEAILSSSTSWGVESIRQLQAVAAEISPKGNRGFSGFD